MPHCVIGTLNVKKDCKEEPALGEGLSDVGAQFDQVVTDSPPLPEPRLAPWQKADPLTVII